MDFNRTTLFISARSPFARRVRLAFLEHGLEFETQILDVFKPNPGLTALNPLSRVPTLKFADGSVLVDSWQILAEFYRAHPQSPFLPTTEKERLLASFWSAIGVGLCEKTVEYYLETLRPAEQHDQAWLGEVRQAAELVLTRLESLIRDRDTIVPGRVTQADLDVGAALAYLSLRYSSEWKTRFPECARYLEALEKRPSFQATRPPA